MALIISSAAIPIMIFSVQLILIHPIVNSGKQERAAPAKLTRDDIFQLRNSFASEIYVSSACAEGCNSIKDMNSIFARKCTDNVNLNTIKCPDHFQILNWDFKLTNERNCIHPTSALGGNYQCVPCVCVHPRNEIVDPDRTGQLIIYQDSATSDVEQNQIVVGLQFVVENLYIDFKIREAKLLGGGKVRKIEHLESDIIALEYDNNAANSSLVAPFKTKLYLDEIFVPIDYVVTGVTYAQKNEGPLQGVAVYLRVQGTKYNSSTYELIKGTQQWFDFNNNNNPDESYNRERKQILLDNCTDPLQDEDPHEKTETNLYVYFRGIGIEYYQTDIVPYFSREAFGSESVPLRGIRLSFKGSEGFGGFIIVKPIPHKSFIRTTTTTTPSTRPPPPPFVNPLPFSKINCLNDSTYSNEEGKDHNDGNEATSDKKSKFSSATKCHCHFFVIIVVHLWITFM